MRPVETCPKCDEIDYPPEHRCSGIRKADLEKRLGAWLAVRPPMYGSLLELARSIAIEAHEEGLREGMNAQAGDVYSKGVIDGQVQERERATKRTQSDEAYVESLRQRVEEHKASAEHRALVIGGLKRELEALKRQHLRLVEATEAHGVGRCDCNHAPCRHDAIRFLEERDEILRILQAIEWEGPGVRTKEENGPLKGLRCPYCHSVKEVSHKENCAVKKALGPCSTG